MTSRVAPYKQTYCVLNLRFGYSDKILIPVFVDPHHAYSRIQDYR